MENTNLKERLLRVERTINRYTQNNELVDEIDIDNLPFEILSAIVRPKEGDHLLYDGYVLTPQQSDSLNSFLENKIEVDMKSFFVLECAGIY